MMRSIRNDFSGSVRIPSASSASPAAGGGMRWWCNELSREKFLAFQTDGRHGLRLTAIQDHADGSDRQIHGETPVKRTGNERRPYGKRIKGIQAASASAPVRRNDLERLPQAAITDPLNTAQSTLTAGNTAATVKQVTESVNRLQTALDYVQKVSTTVRRTDVHGPDRPAAEPVEQQLPQDAGRRKMDMKGAAGHHFGRAGRGGEQRRHHLPDHGHTRQ